MHTYRKKRLNPILSSFLIVHQSTTSKLFLALELAVIRLDSMPSSSIFILKAMFSNTSLQENQRPFLEKGLSLKFVNHIVVLRLGKTRWSLYIILL